jgi:hypothetical protein
MVLPEWAPDLPSNNRLGWKLFLGTNTLAYNKAVSITTIKSFKQQFPGVKARKTFFGL